MAALTELHAKLAQLDCDIDTACARAIATSQARINEFDLTALDHGLIKAEVIASRKNAPHSLPLTTHRGSQPPRYRNHPTGATWSGFERTPHWIVGEDRNEFLIKNQQQAA